MRVTEETATVYRSRGVRWITKLQAYRHAAKHEFLKKNKRLPDKSELDELARELMDSDDIERRNQHATE